MDLFTVFNLLPPLYYKLLVGKNPDFTHRHLPNT